MFLTAQATIAAKPLARALDAALAFTAASGPLAGSHLLLTESGLVVLGSDRVGVCASTVETQDASGLAGRWLTLSEPDAEETIDWIRATGHERLHLKIARTALSLVPPAGASWQVGVVTTDPPADGSDVRGDLLRSIAVIACDWAPVSAVPAGLLLRLAEIQHLGSASAPAVELVPTASGWAGSFDDRAAVFAYAAPRIPCDAPGVLAHVAATGTGLAASGTGLLDGGAEDDHTPGSRARTHDGHPTPEETR